MKADMQFKTQPIRDLKTGLVDTKKRKARLANVKSYNLDALAETLPSGLSADMTFTVATEEGTASVTLKHE